MKGRNGGNYNGENNYEKRTSSLCHTLICKYKIRQVRDEIKVIFRFGFELIFSDLPGNYTK